MKAYVGPHKSLISGYGDSLSDALAQMSEGKTALRPRTWDDGAEYYAQCADRRAKTATLSRLEAMGADALRDCMAGNKWEPEAGRKTGVIFSTTKGNIAEAQAAAPEEGSRILIYEMAQRICAAAGLEGMDPIVICNACISGVAATVAGSRLIRRGEYDDIFVVGLDEASRFVTSGFLGFRSVSAKPCAPYDARRDGLSLGEAAGCILLTNKKLADGAPVVEGGSLSNDANHISGPSRTGEPLAKAIGRAMGQSRRAVEEMAFVNAHGTGTVYNDEMEAKALDAVGMGGKPLNSLKPYLGHTLGASGLIELMVCDDELRRGEILPTLWFESLGVSKRLSVGAEKQRAEGSFCVKTASGFGGCNAAVVLSKATEARDVDETTPDKMTLVRSVDIAGGKILVDGRDVLGDDVERDFGTLVRDAYHALGDQNLKFFKMDDLCKMGYIGAEYLLRGIEACEAERREMAILMANRSASLDTDIVYIGQMEEGTASPAKFVYTLPNIVIGEICIRHKIQGENLFVVMPQRDDEKLRHMATRMLDLSRAKMVICGWCEKLADTYELHLELQKPH